MIFEAEKRLFLFEVRKKENRREENVGSVVCTTITFEFFVYFLLQFFFFFRLLIYLTRFEICKKQIYLIRPQNSSANSECVHESVNMFKFTVHTLFDFCSEQSRKKIRFQGFSHISFFFLFFFLFAFEYGRLKKKKKL